MLHGTSKSSIHVVRNIRSCIKQQLKYIQWLTPTTACHFDKRATDVGVSRSGVLKTNAAHPFAACAARRQGHIAYINVGTSALRLQPTMDPWTTKADALPRKLARRRSGRPSTDSTMHNGSKGARPSPGSSLSLDSYNDGSSSRIHVECPETVTPDQAGPRGTSWPNTSSMSSFQAIDTFMDFGEEANGASCFDAGNAIEHAFEVQANGVFPRENPSSENTNTKWNAMEAIIRELTDLSLRAYRVAIAGRNPSTDDLLEMTQSLMNVLARVEKAVRRQENGVTAPISREQDLTADLQFGSQALVSLVFQVVSVCEQMYNAFVHVCSLIHCELDRRGQSSCSGKENDDRIPNAQAVMTAELINYLFEKLSRGQRQLLDIVLIPDNGSSNGENGSTPDIPAGILPLLFDSSSESPSNMMSSMMHRARGKHPQLHRYIQAIRDSTWQSNLV
jgi:predicted RNA-binding Zn ribbon-like protein